MQGLISLGIYTPAGKLIRVLHRAATGDEFAIAVDGYITHWDGLDDAGHPAPPAHYTARGYMVGNVTVHHIDIHSIIPLPAAQTSPAASPAPGKTPFPPLYALKFPNGKPFKPQDKLYVSLLPNPLDRDRAGDADLAVCLYPDASWLQLADGLPLLQIAPTSPEIAAELNMENKAHAVPKNTAYIELGRSAPGEPLIVYILFRGIVDAYSITNISNMMAFDCGDFDLPAPSK